MPDFKSGLSPLTVAEAVGGKVLYAGRCLIHGVCIDSRKVFNGSLFVAIKGENTDGHLYISSAISSGASCIFTEKDDIDLSQAAGSSCTVILVENSVLALGKLAKYYKSQFNLTTVGVTGSVGKTTTRQFIYAVLSQGLNTHKTEGNFNNELGLPLSLCEISSSHQASVLEMGMSSKGEISYLTKIARPDIAVITNIGTAHIEYLGSREAIRDAKLEIREGMADGSYLILNGDEPLLSGIDGAYYVAINNKSADFVAENIRFCDDGMRFDLKAPDRTVFDCYISTFGEHTVLDAAYAFACGYFLGLSDDLIKQGLASYQAVGMRQSICTSNGITYVLDYYNASPESVRASFDITKRLASAKGGRAVAVIGSILELGEHSEPLHRQLGSYFFSNGADLLFTFGKDALSIADQAIAEGASKERVFAYESSDDVSDISERIASSLLPSDCVLIKGSHGMHMERIADLLIK